MIENFSTLNKTKTLQEQDMIQNITKTGILLMHLQTRFGM